MAKKPRANKANPATAPLLSALKFLEPAMSDEGQVNQTHCLLTNGWAVAFNGVITLATKIDTDIQACPNAMKLLNALSKCDDKTQITQLANTISIKSGRYSASIPCVDPELIVIEPPTPMMLPIDDSVREALAIVGEVVSDTAPRMVAASVLLRNGSAVATDGTIIFEAWHGQYIPEPGVVFPKAFVTALSKIPKKIVGISATATTASIYFEDQSWIRTQLYTEQYPNVDRILNEQANAIPIPEGFFEALEKIEGQADDGRVYFGNLKLQTHNIDEAGAIYEIDGIPSGICYDIDYLRMFKGLATQADFQAKNNQMGIFYGDRFRGMLMQILIQKTPEVRDIQPTGPQLVQTIPDDIPF
jgi:hypothetical protein